MASSTDNHYTHEECDIYFTEAFRTFAELRKSKIMTDITLTTSNDPVIHNSIECESRSKETEFSNNTSEKMVTILNVIHKDWLCY